MPEERIYQSRVDPRAAAPLPLASPEVYGAGIGRAAEQLGGTLHEANLRAYKLEREQKADSETADFLHRFGQVREDMDNASREARNSTSPGAEGHAKAMADAIEARRSELLDSITEDSVRRQATAQFEDFAGRFRKSESDFQEGKRIGKLVTDVSSASDIAANRARRLHDQEAYAEELRLGFASIDALSAPADVKEQLKKRHEQVVTIGFVNGLNDTNPALAKSLIDAGMFDERLEPGQIDQLRNGAEVEIRRADAAAEHQANMAAAQLREEIATLEEYDRQGIDVSDKLPAAVQVAAAIGDSSLSVKLEGLLQNSQYAKIYSGQTPVQREQRLTALASIDNPSVEQQRELKWLREHNGALDSQFNSDPVAFAAINAPPGAKPPPLNLADPQSVQSRVQWARNAAQAYGRPVPFFSRNEAATLTQRAASSPKERLAVANDLAMFGGANAAAAARQVSPNDPMLARLVVLNANDRFAATNGIDVRRGNPGLIDQKPVRDQAYEDFTETMGFAARLLPAGDVNAVFDIAGNLYADWAAQRGIQAFDGNFEPFIQRALGATKNRRGEVQGGVARWNNAAVLLPQKASLREFETVLSRMSWQPTDPNAPVWHDGHPMTPAEVRRHVPVQRLDGRYEFHGPDGTVGTSRDGTIWTLDIAKLTARLPK